MRLDPDVNVAIDPASGIAAEMDPRLPIANIAELADRIEEIERAAIDLADSLNPSTVSYPSYPNREGIYLNHGGFPMTLSVSFSGLLRLLFC